MFFVTFAWTSFSRYSNTSLSSYTRLSFCLFLASNIWPRISQLLCHKNIFWMANALRSRRHLQPSTFLELFAFGTCTGNAKVFGVPKMSRTGVCACAAIFQRCHEKPSALLSKPRERQRGRAQKAQRESEQSLQRQQKQNFKTNKRERTRSPPLLSNF